MSSPHKVLPCPFCGSRVEMIFKMGEWGYSSDAVFIQCKPCGIMFMEDAEKWEQGKGTYSICDQAEKKLLDRWNTRLGKLECEPSSSASS